MGLSKTSLGDAPQQPSKTKRKKAAKAAQRVGEKLTALNDEQLGRMDLPAELFDAVVALRDMRQHGARRRQMQYIGALMRNVDVQNLQLNIEKATARQHEEARRFRRVEKWRDDLTSGDAHRLTWIVAHYPEADRDRLEQMAGDVLQAKSVAERRRKNRTLFRYLRALMG